MSATGRRASRRGRQTARVLRCASLTLIGANQGLRLGREGPPVLWRQVDRRRLLKRRAYSDVKGAMMVELSRS